jgi:hypothetical protein
MMKRIIPILSAVLMVLLAFAGCSQTPQTDLSGSVDAETRAVNPAEWEGIHSDGKLTMFIGQDLQAEYEYVNSGKFPIPAGVVSYMPLPDLLGLWTETDWGSGPVCTLSAAEGYPESMLAVAVYMVEDQWMPNRLTDITSGRYDDKIGEFGWFIGNKCVVTRPDGSKLQYPVHVRIGFEFDGNWNHYDPVKYKAAYKHIVDIIRPLAPNAVFVWQSSTSPIDDIIEGGIHEDLMLWYPGDDYVDLMGLSWFLSSDPRQLTLANELCDLARARNKPVMICEATPQGYDLTNLNKKNITSILDGASGTGQINKTADQIWNEWFVPYFNFIYGNSDVIRVVTYINCNWNSQAKWGPPYPEGYWGDSRIQQNSVITQKWNAELAKPVWAHGSQDTMIKVNEGGGTPVINVASPVFEPAAGSYSGSVNVTLTCSTTGATIRYRRNGGAWTNYTGAIALTTTGTTAIDTYAVKSGLTDSTTSSATYTVTPVNAQIPYGNGGNPWPLADGKIIEAENYDDGGEGVAYHDADASNSGGKGRTNQGVDLQTCSEGGLNLGWTNAGEWLEYTTTVTPAKYDITVRVASPNTSGKLVLKLGSQTLGTVTVPNTGAWQTWKDVVIQDVEITASGMQILRADITGAGFNLNYMKFVKDSGGDDVVLGSLANGDSFAWNVNLTEAGMYRAEITSGSTQNSQLIDVSMGGSTTTQAIDAGKTISSYMHNVPAGPAVFKITAKSNAVNISAVKLFAPSGAVVSLTGSTNIDTVAAPVFTPAGGTYVNSVSVTLGCPTAGATILYNRNGGTWTTYTGAIVLGTVGTTTITAYAVKSGMTNSGMVSSTYAVQENGDGPEEPAAGKTLVMIGQTFQSEYVGYINGTGKAPAGSSHYAEIYSGKINQGDDANNQAFLKWVSANYPDSCMLVAISIKDNPAAGGYGSLNPNDPNYNPRAVYQACKDIAAGKWDAQIDSIAGTFKANPRITFAVRIGYEVSMGMFANQTSEDWNDILTRYASQGKNILENPSLAPEIDLTAYRDAYNYIARRIRVTNGCNNVEFVYHPVRGYGDCVNLYPGDQYVDWIGFSVFNHDVCMDTLEANGSVVTNGTGTLDTNLQKCVVWAQAKGKKLMVAESAFQYPSGGQTAANFQTYLTRLFSLIETYDFRMLVYINSNWTAHDWTRPWGDSRVESNSTVKTWWMNKINQSRYISY